MSQWLWMNKLWEISICVELWMKVKEPWHDESISQFWINIENLCILLFGIIWMFSHKVAFFLSFIGRRIHTVGIITGSVSLWNLCTLLEDFIFLSIITIVLQYNSWNMFLWWWWWKLYHLIEWINIQWIRWIDFMHTFSCWLRYFKLPYDYS